MSGTIGLRKKNLKKRFRRTMDVNVIFQNSVPIDNNKNFLVKFRDQENIMSLLLNRKKTIL